MFHSFCDMLPRRACPSGACGWAAGHNYIGTEHILMGLLREGEGVAARVLETLGADQAKIRTQVRGRVGCGLVGLQTWARPGTSSCAVQMTHCWHQLGDPSGAAPWCSCVEYIRTDEGALTRAAGRVRRGQQLGPHSKACGAQAGCTCARAGHPHGGREPGGGGRGRRLRPQQQQDADAGGVRHQPDHAGHGGAAPRLALAGVRGFV